MVKNPPASSGDPKSHKFDPWVGKIPWSRKWQPTPVFLPGESHGQRSLVGCSPWGLRVGHDWVTEHTHTQSTPLSLTDKESRTKQHIISKVYLKSICQVCTPK